MDATELSTPGEAIDRATKEQQLVEIEALCAPNEHEMETLVRTVEHLADGSEHSPPEVASLARDFAAKGFDPADICAACEVAVGFGGSSD